MYYSVFKIIFSFPLSKNYLLRAYSPVLSLQVSGLHRRSATSSYFPIHSNLLQY